MKAIAVLARSKFLVKHWGVLLDNGCVLHNTPQQGVHISSFHDYAEGKTVEQTPIPFEFQSASAPRILEAISQPSGYSLLSNNCQHTANEVAYGMRQSGYVAFGIVALLGIILFSSAN